MALSGAGAPKPITFPPRIYVKKPLARLTDQELDERLLPKNARSRMDCYQSEDGLVPFSDGDEIAIYQLVDTHRVRINRSIEPPGGDS